ncbi:hypothetical protein IM40_10250 (plasmid) [Candidatus Paracaedimonas acanthamoebae]|nr:hypothetical protein IM40_10250 [Candidatus Paracaedimonas acanthamoebae]
MRKHLNLRKLFALNASIMALTFSTATLASSSQGHRLPEDVWGVIAEFLPASDVRSLKATCKSMDEPCRLGFKNKTFNLSKYNLNTGMNSLLTLLEEVTPRKLIFPNSATQDQIRTILEKCQNIQELSLREANIDDITILHNLTNLKVLSLKINDRNRAHIVDLLKALPSIENVTFYGRRYAKALQGLSKQASKPGLKYGFVHSIDD